MSVVVSFRVEAYIAARVSVGPERLGQFDQALGEALVTIAHTPQVWRQAVSPTLPEETSGGLALAYASQWRTVFENVKKAANWVTILTGSPAVAIVAETLLDRVLPPNTTRRVAIGDVLIGDKPAEEWLEQLEASDRAEARKEIEEAVERSLAPKGPPPWYLRIFNRPFLAIAALMLIATAWSAWDAWIRRKVDPDTPPQVEVAVTLPEPVDASPTPDRVEVQVRATPVTPACVPVRVQRGRATERFCAPTD